MQMLRIRNKKSGKFSTSLSRKDKKVIDKAVKKTVKDYKRTLDLLAKT